MVTNFSEQTLVLRSQQGDLDAFNQLVLQYQDALYRYAITLASDPDLAADITQDSFIKAFQHIGSLRGHSFRTWLFKIATNTARDLARQRARHPITSLYPTDENDEENDSPAWLTDPNQSVEAAVQQRDISRLLYRVLNELSTEHRSILILIDLHGMDYVEAAHVLHIPLGTVKSRLARARAGMKDKLLGSNEHTPFLPKDSPITTYAIKSPVSRAHVQTAEMAR